MGWLDRLQQLEQKIESLIYDAPAEAVKPSAPASGNSDGGSPHVAQSAVDLKPVQRPPEKETAPTGATSAPLPSWEPLELRKAVLKDIEHALHPMDGEMTFPYNRIDLELLIPSEQVRARYQTELQDGARLEKEIQRLLASARVTSAPRFELHFHYLQPSKVKTPEVLSRGYLVECSHEQLTDRMPRPATQRPQLVVELGKAEPSSLALGPKRINIGRLEEIRGQDGMLLRRNDLIFADEAGVNSSVSRLHAHIEFDESTQEHRLYDDNSAEGTHVFRAGNMLKVARGNRRGLALRPEDEIFLGQARLKVMGPK